MMKNDLRRSTELDAIGMLLIYPSSRLAPSCVPKLTTPRSMSMHRGRLVKFSAHKLALLTLCAATGVVAAHPAYSASDPLGIWVDEDKRGAVEVRRCGNSLCGYVVWVRDPKDRHGCGQQLMGDVVRTGSGWDNGWIASPEDGSKYSVAIEPVSQNSLKVIGYAGSKLFSKTMMWTRANGKVERCDTPPEPKVITASLTPSKAAAPVAKSKAAPAKPIASGPRSAPAPHRKPATLLVSLEPEIVAPAPILAQRPRSALPPPMALGRGVDVIDMTADDGADVFSDAGESAADNGAVAQQHATTANDCGLRAPFFALFASACANR